MQKGRISVTAAIIMEGRDIFVARRNMNQVRGGKWEFPGGKVEANEAPQDALRRELREEFDSESEILSHAVTVQHQYPDITILLICYWARIEKIPEVLNAHSAAQWISPEKLFSLDLAAADRKAAELLFRS
ncbi:MAG: (deoxy)nucleoside triphosphate pyrophosphohydrolase [Spirochaetia bacterium]